MCTFLYFLLPMLVVIRILVCAYYFITRSCLICTVGVDHCIITIFISLLCFSFIARPSNDRSPTVAVPHLTPQLYAALRKNEIMNAGFECLNVGKKKKIASELI